MDLNKTLGLGAGGAAVILHDRVALIAEHLVKDHYYLALDVFHQALMLAKYSLSPEEFMQLAQSEFENLWRAIEEHASNAISDWEGSNEEEPLPAVNRAILAKTSAMLQDVLSDLRNQATVRTPKAFLNALENLCYEFQDDLELEFRRFDAKVSIFAQSISPEPISR